MAPPLGRHQPSAAFEGGVIMQWLRWIYALPARLRAMVRPDRLEQELDDELSFHLAMQTHANLQAG